MTLTKVRKTGIQMPGDWFYWVLVGMFVVFMLLLILIFTKEGFPTW